uniref:G-protein coupled receptors family 1 profile domain-containing protein n=1 Tax=Cynoglossus semilaevis TaxID=244447 RepID=A0A3P8V004_CYNSE
MVPWNTTASQGQLGNHSDNGLADVEKILVPILDTLILVLGVGGHTVVMVILCGRLSAGTGTDILLVALSVADLLLLSMLPFHTVAIAMQRWPFGDFMCRLVGFLGSACSSASVFTLAVLAVSRYLTIVHPAKAYSLLSSPRVSAAAALLWVPACCLAVPQLVFRSVGTPKLAADGLACFSFQSHRDQVIYGLVHFVMAFLLPLITIAVAYSSIYVFLWRSQNNGRAPQVERYQRKVTQTSAMLVLAFTLCWLPSYGLMLALLEDNRSGATGTSPRYGAFTVFARVMATSSTVVNPILYVLMSEKFRQDLLRLFKRAGMKNICDIMEQNRTLWPHTAYVIVADGGQISSEAGQVRLSRRVALTCHSSKCSSQTQTQRTCPCCYWQEPLLCCPQFPG